MLVPPDEHAASPGQPKRRRDGESKIIPTPKRLSKVPVERSMSYWSELRAERFALLTMPPVERIVRSSGSPSPASRRSGCVRPSAQWFRWGCIRTAIRLMLGVFVGHQAIVRSRDGMWATVPRQCCRPIGRSCDGEPRAVAPAAGSDAPTRCGSPSALSSGRGSTIRTSDPDRLRPAGSLNRGQPRRAATRDRSGSRSAAQRPTHGARSDTRPDVAGALDQVLWAHLASAIRVRPSHTRSAAGARRAAAARRFGPTPGEDPVSESPPPNLQIVRTRPATRPKWGDSAR